jgi:hypothetical protein
MNIYMKRGNKLAGDLNLVEYIDMQAVESQLTFRKYVAYIYSAGY